MAEHKDIKEARNIKKRKKKEGCGNHYVIYSIERYNLLKLFSLHSFYVID